MRHSQLPPTVPGKFMRASPPRRSRSCMGMMAVSAQLAHAARSSAGMMSSSFSAMLSFLRAKAFTEGFASAHQPSVVLLSWVPV